MFRKSKAEKADHAAKKDALGARAAAATAAERAANSVQHQASALAHTVKEKAGPRAEELAASAAGLAATARDRAVTSLDQHIDTAVPKVDAAVAGMAPRVDHARDVIVEDVLPKIHDMLLSLQAGKDDLLSKQNGTVAALTGAPKKQSRKGGVLIAMALLAAAGAGIAWYLNKQQSQPKPDPWATPSRPIGGAPGVDSQVRDSLGSSFGAAGAGAGATGADAVAAEAHDSVEAAAAESETRLLDSEEIDELAAEAQTEDITGLGDDADSTESERNADLGDLGGKSRP